MRAKEAHWHAISNPAYGWVYSSSNVDWNSAIDSTKSASLRRRRERMFRELARDCSGSKREICPRGHSSSTSLLHLIDCSM
jgi:hypothetical protein